MALITRPRAEGSEPRPTDLANVLEPEGDRPVVAQRPVPKGRRAYQPPTLTVLGAIGRLTGAVANFNNKDGGMMAGKRRSG